MQKVIAISLTGHTRQFRLTEEAYADLDRYLAQARARLGERADPDEVIGDLERSIGERLDGLAPDDRVLDASQVRGVLDEIGAVDVDRGPATSTARPTAHRASCTGSARARPIAGVCNGLAAYSDLDLELVRSIFALLAIFTGGLFLIVYLVMMFVLPIVETREEWIRVLAEADDARRA